MQSCDVLGVVSMGKQIFQLPVIHDDVIKWKHFSRYWPFVRGVHRPPVNSPHKSQWRGALMFLWSASWINGWVNNREAGDLRRYRAYHDVMVMIRRHKAPLMALYLSRCVCSTVAESSVEFQSNKKIASRLTASKVLEQIRQNVCLLIEWKPSHVL